MRVDLKNNQNIIIGWLMDSGSQIQAMHRTKGYLGFYNKNTDITFTKSGSIFCYGNGAESLIRFADRNISLQ